MKRTKFTGSRADLEAKCDAASKFLRETGWEYRGAIIHADDDLNYGTMWVKDGGTIYLNFQTVDLILKVATQAG